MVRMVVLFVLAIGDHREFASHLFAVWADDWPHDWLRSILDLVIRDQLTVLENLDSTVVLVQLVLSARGLSNR